LDSEIEDVVVGQGADVGSDCGQAPNVVRVHPIVHRFAAHELAGGGNCRFQIDQPDIGCEPIQHVHRFPPRPREFGRRWNLTVDLFGERDIDPGVSDNGLPQLRISAMRQYLINPTTGHHIATKKDQRAAGRPRDGPVHARDA
jgi:hypothetical protein